jgi:hypothetical protein
VILLDTTVLNNFSHVERPDLDERFSPQLPLHAASHSGYNGPVCTVEITDESRKGVKAGYTCFEPALADIDPTAQDGWISILVS